MRPLTKWDSRVLPAVAIVWLLFLFVAQLRSLVRHRLDYPIVDDWRYYMGDYALPHSLSLRWLAKPAQDTVHVSGKLLDWLYFHFVSHDYSSLAAVSFAICIGCWLFCSIRLCWRAARGRPLVLVSALLSCTLPLAAVPYWVTIAPEQWLEPLIAYHQMLPIVGLFALGLLVSSEAPWTLAARGRVAAIVVTLFFGLSYSSGAVALFVFGGTLAAAAWSSRRSQPGHDPLLSIGAAIVAAALVCLAAHVALPMLSYGVNPVTETRWHSLTLPWESRYWHFFFALFDRALLSTRVDGPSFLRGAVVSIAVVTPVVLLFALVARGRIDGKKRSSVVAIAAIIAAVVVYASLVSYGRASFGTFYFALLHPPNERASLYAHSRFFYWWISAILPLAIVGWGVVAERLSSRRSAGLVAVVLVVVALLPKGEPQDHGPTYLGHWNYEARYSRDAAELRALIACDFKRARGEECVSPRRKMWGELPIDLRNEDFVSDSSGMTYHQFRPLSARARAAGATFVLRWRQPGRSGGLRPRGGAGAGAQGSR